jgi:uncharacterized OsmC-like protein
VLAGPRGSRGSTSPALRELRSPWALPPLGPDRRCAGVTLGAVATAIGVTVKKGSVHAEGDLDFRGTLGVAKDAAVGFKAIRLRFDLDADATEDQIATLLKLTERYCVVAQSLRHPPSFSISRRA